ncbi:MAG TPA: four-helix bundle copper-binding protein [Alphaproteobacteria bacterium]|jgi:hypothetical protein|nr:four-helix bundle copper-binding protein [Alphaproteobacteria bacterium]
MLAREIISAHPDVQGNVSDVLIRCIEECFGCGQTCTSCADACLAEPKIDRLKECIRRCLDCADVCLATGRVVSRRTGSDRNVVRQMLEACAAACRYCGDVCEHHAKEHEHCRICGEECRRCERACREAMQSVH